MEIKRLRNYKGILVVGVVFLVGFLSFMFGFSRAKYQQTQDMRLVNGIVNYKMSDMSVVAMYQESESGYQEISEIPSGGGVFVK